MALRMTMTWRLAWLTVAVLLNVLAAVALVSNGAPGTWLAALLPGLIGLVDLPVSVL